MEPKKRRIEEYPRERRGTPTRRWRDANDFDPYKRLAAAIIQKACKDFSNLCRKLESPYLRADLAESYETECNNIELWLLDPTNVYIEYLDIDPEVIRDYVMLRSKDAEDWPAELLAKEMD